MTDTAPAVPETTTLTALLEEAPDLRRRLGGTSQDWTIDEVGDANVNFVFRVGGPEGAVCVKQAPPYVRVAGRSWPLTPERVVYEYRALEEHGRAAPGAVPTPLHLERDAHLLVMEFVEGQTVLRHHLSRGGVHPGLGEQVGGYLARTLFATSDLGMDAGRKRDLVAEFETNTEMCRMTEEMVFTEVYHDFHRNRWTTPDLDAEVLALRSDSEVLTAVSRLKYRYLTSREALLHGDLHTGSVMVGAGCSRVFDHEFACFGPLGFDIGGFLAHLLIAYFAADARDGGRRRAVAGESVQQMWLLEEVERTWDAFREGFLDRWRSAAHGSAFPARLFTGPGAEVALEAERSAYLERVLTDAVGFCGAELIRRLVGFARPVDLTGIGDRATRAGCEIRAMRLARSLLTEADGYRSVADVTAAARHLRAGWYPG
ncbi:S-methyl-5-thioribose kinase [Nocardiopsis sp. NPDC007018]|uniref:S-methyl-5-thioribose kinase n=1 Tax=Nocardiopsis sp. NPDC007018 TaxID=3155721 RepID=UPI0033E2121F